MQGRQRREGNLQRESASKTTGQTEHGFWKYQPGTQGEGESKPSVLNALDH